MDGINLTGLVFNGLYGSLSFLSLPSSLHIGNKALCPLWRVSGSFDNPLVFTRYCPQFTESDCFSVARGKGAKAHLRF